MRRLQLLQRVRRLCQRCSVFRTALSFPAALRWARRRRDLFECCLGVRGAGDMLQERVDRGAHVLLQ